MFAYRSFKNRQRNHKTVQQIQNEGFLRYAAHFGVVQLYNVPSRRYFTDTAMPTLKTKTKVKVSLKQAGRIAVTCDAWTPIATELYVTITAHFITN